jgi:hypothetical protein
VQTDSIQMKRIYKNISNIKKVALGKTRRVFLHLTLISKDFEIKVKASKME